jgi:hypothetical protein
MTPFVDHSIDLTHLVVAVQCAVYGLVLQKLFAMLLVIHKPHPTSAVCTPTSTNKATERHSHRHEERQKGLYYYRLDETPLPGVV